MSLSGGEQEEAQKRIVEGLRGSHPHTSRHYHVSTDTFGSIATAFRNGETVWRDAGSFCVSVSMERCKVFRCVSVYGERCKVFWCVSVYEDFGCVSEERCRVFWCVCKYGEMQGLLMCL